MDAAQAKAYLDEQNERFTLTMAKEMKEAMQQATEALDKQIPQIPQVEGDGYAYGTNQIAYDIWYCPCCNSDYEYPDQKEKYCPNCGQAINWEGWE